MTPACSRRAMILATCATVLATIASTGMAQTSPAGPVTLVVARAPGGLGEVAAHSISDKLAKALGQPVEIDFRPGASGAVGAQSVASAAPDGRTLLLGQTAEIVIEPYLITGFNPRLEPIALVAIAPLALVARAAAPYPSIQEFLQAAQTGPRDLSFASAGRYTPGYFAAELLRSRIGARFQAPPFRRRRTGSERARGRSRGLLLRHPSLSNAPYQGREAEGARRFLKKPRFGSARRADARGERDTALRYHALGRRVRAAWRIEGFRESVQSGHQPNSDAAGGQRWAGA